MYTPALQNATPSDITFTGPSGPLRGLREAVSEFVSVRPISPYVSMVYKTLVFHLKFWLEGFGKKGLKPICTEKFGLIEALPKGWERV